MMKVKALIKELQRYPPESYALIRDYDDGIRIISHPSDLSTLNFIDLNPIINSDSDYYPDPPEEIDR